MGLLDFGSVGRLDAGMRGALQRLLLAVDRGNPLALTDALLEMVERPETLDEERLRRAWAASWPVMFRRRHARRLHVQRPVPHRLGL